MKWSLTASLGLKCISINKCHCTTLISRYKRRRNTAQNHLADAVEDFCF